MPECADTAIPQLYGTVVPNRLDIICDVTHLSIMRLVLDTNIVVAGLRSPAGASAELLRRLRKGHGELLLSVPLILEYEAVCCLPEHLQASGLSEAEVVQVLDVLVAIATPVEIKFLWRPQLRDAADEMVLETAANGMAEVIVTFNERDFRPAAGRFGLVICSPGEMLGRIAT